MEDTTPALDKGAVIVGEVDGEYRLWADSKLVGYVNNSDMDDEQFRVAYYQNLANGQNAAYEFLKKNGRIVSKQSKTIPHHEKPVSENTFAGLVERLYSESCDGDEDESPEGSDYGPYHDGDDPPPGTDSRP